MAQADFRGAPGRIGQQRFRRGGMRKLVEPVMLGRPHGVVAEAIGELDLRDAFVKGAPLALGRGLQDLDFEQD